MNQWNDCHSKGFWLQVDCAYCLLSDLPGFPEEPPHLWLQLESWERGRNSVFHGIPTTGNDWWWSNALLQLVRFTTSNCCHLHHHHHHHHNEYHQYHDVSLLNPHSPFFHSVWSSGQIILETILLQSMLQAMLLYLQGGCGMINTQCNCSKILLPLCDFYTSMKNGAE